jgi:hypothetical protein
MGRLIKVNDKMQKGYQYELVEPEGKNFHPDFKPELTPKQMLALGVFGGRYMRDTRNEFPEEWFDNAIFHPEGKSGNDKDLNYFKVEASMPLKVWQAKEWIHPDDPRGWLQWYARYFMGRRHDDDLRQIKRWKAFRRHCGAVKIHCLKGDLDCRRRQRQALFHWAYDSRKI